MPTISTKSSKRCERCAKPCETWFTVDGVDRYMCLHCAGAGDKKRTKAKGETEDKKWLFLDAWRKWAGDAPPPPKTEYHFLRPIKNSRADFAYPEHRLLIEIDGGSQMVVTSETTGKTMVGGRHNTEADRLKMNLAAAYGWRVIRFTPQQLERDPAGCVEIVLLALKLARKEAA